MDNDIPAVMKNLFKTNSQILLSIMKSSPVRTVRPNSSGQLSFCCLEEIDEQLRIFIKHS